MNIDLKDLRKIVKQGGHISDITLLDCLDNLQDRIENLELTSEASAHRVRALETAVKAQNEVLGKLNVHTEPKAEYEAEGKTDLDAMCECGKPFGRHSASPKHSCGISNCQSFKEAKKEPEIPITLVEARKQIREILYSPGPVETLDCLYRVAAELYHATAKEFLKAGKAGRE